MRPTPRRLRSALSAVSRWRCSIHSIRSALGRWRHATQMSTCACLPRSRGTGLAKKIILVIVGAAEVTVEVGDGLGPGRHARSGAPDVTALTRLFVVLF